MFGFANELSLILVIDGEGCGEESNMGWIGFPIWVLLAVYLMAGQFVICEEYFVPILAQLGNRLKMEEDVQGATLLAVGSSSPELFTALIGAILYPEANVGPSTNVGSAVFNLCVIIGLSAIFAPRSVKLQMVPFLRDSICYMVGLVILYMSYAVVTPGSMDIIESIVLVAWWALYAFFVYRTDLLKARCCCCIPEAEKENVEHEMEPVDDDEAADAMGAEAERPGQSVIRRSKFGNKIGVSFDRRGGPVLDMDYCPNNIRMSRAIPEDVATDDDTVQRLVDDLNRRQRVNVNKGWIVVVMPGEGKLRGGGGTSQHGPVSDQDESGRAGADPMSSNMLYVRRRTFLETLTHSAELRDHREDADEHGEGGHGGLLHKALMPWTKLFSVSMPSPEGKFVTNHIYLSIAVIVAWLGLLTFFVVDFCTKIGECIGMTTALLGITLLAVGSSLPDCISSVIVARQMKIDMAVANAFGSNIFDVNLCVGFSFLMGSIVSAIGGGGTSIDLGDHDQLVQVDELIIAAALYLVILWGMIWCSLFKLEKWIGYVLLVMFAAFIVTFTVLFQFS